jgi:hypothetical protein
LSGKGGKVLGWEGVKGSEDRLILSENPGIESNWAGGEVRR